MKGLQDKVAIVTGAGGGIGRQICLRLAQAGAQIALFDIDAENARAVAEHVTELGVRCSVYPVDIVDHDVVGDAVRAARSQFGSIDILINNAGWDLAEEFVKTTPELWQKIIAINYVGPLNLHHHVLPVMLGQGAGKVINISSDAGRVGSSGESVYAGCKAAVIAFGKSVARELAKSGISINTVCPGPTDTNLFRDFAGEGEFGAKVRAGLERAIPMRRLGQPEDIAGVVAFLASEDANYITGQTISVSGGLTMHG
ncbi:MAG: 2-hydroxycyclohexanecarboxyl-CoA dehydrogenase [Gammaproteobacteria bacterium]|nr:MAG: 2-hydroxycyclohexanecarboxyl-CoA dehydrogenase [Gammaproteobacteria bacterium]RLA59387.1 MAG: 2-hydroxycyclohexanecarboxyl-CoA dehydrogenase [Gammaproteobacteria bacterium]